jgi:hypothetical protein
MRSEDYEPRGDLKRPPTITQRADMDSSATLDRLEKFIPTIKGISTANRQGLTHILGLLKGEQAARDADAYSRQSNLNGLRKE